MARRFAYFVKNNILCYKFVDITWDLGFNREAKHEYVRRMIDALGKDVGRACDVTTGSPVYDTRILSPVFVKVHKSNMSVEDWVNAKIPEDTPHRFELPIVHYAYITGLTERNLTTISQYDCFFDVFTNPDKGLYNTQAYLVGMVKWMMLNDKMGLILDYGKFKSFDLEFRDTIQEYIG